MKTEKPKFCFANCPFLKPTEMEQDLLKAKEPHFCVKYQRALSHLNFHPEIKRLDECKIIRKINAIEVESVTMDKAKIYVNGKIIESEFVEMKGLL